ncbi:SPOR domain-containing protein [Undibacterium parvum]|uniref:SPOR domain-containing protein n=1 Tax=Undibacterium parvum TaxID=401471 RepID=A0A3S9HKE8_9BURK|nr:SPOR domain-containing protein [Undibacterium parvum]AZP12573.1 SPOR domain-containing protein [Undibacterium parvum]
MLRFFFWTLLLLNSLLLAFNLGYLGTWPFASNEPQRINQQHNTDKIQLLSASAVLALTEAPSESAKAAQDKAKELIACLEVGNFLPAEAITFEEKLKTLALGERQARSNVSEVASHMVYIPPQGSKEGADKKTAELRRIGISDFFVMQEPANLRWAISLGVFKSEEAAKAHLANLNSKGVKSARIGPREVSTAKFSYQLRKLNVDEKSRFDAIKASYPNQESRHCAVAAQSRN